MASIRLSRAAEGCFSFFLRVSFSLSLSFILNLAGREAMAWSHVVALVFLFALASHCRAQSIVTQELPVGDAVAAGLGLSRVSGTPAYTNTTTTTPSHRSSPLETSGVDSVTDGNEIGQTDSAISHDDLPSPNATISQAPGTVSLRGSSFAAATGSITRGVGAVWNTSSSGSAYNTTSFSGHGAGFASKCSGVLVDYQSAADAWGSTYNYLTSSLSIDCDPQSSINILNYTGPLTTLCDGYPRALSMRQTQTVWENTGCTTYTQDYITYNYTKAPPCTIGTSDCANLWSAWSSYQDTEYTTPMAIPPCQTASCEACSITAATLQLLYWPVTVMPPTLCANGTINATTLTMPQTGDGPNTAVVGDTTLTSPTVYLSYKDIQAGPDLIYTGCGSKIASAIIPLEPDAVYSIVDGALSASQSFDFGNLPPNPVPFSLYSPQLRRTGNQACTYGLHNDECHLRDKVRRDDLPQWTIYPDYAPWIIMPDKVRDLEPEWSTCQINFVSEYDGTTYYWGVLDPPSALMSASLLVDPTPASQAPGKTTKLPKFSAAPIAPSPAATPRPAAATPTDAGQGSGSSNPDPGSGSDGDDPSGANSGSSPGSSSGSGSPAPHANPAIPSAAGQGDPVATVGGVTLSVDPADPSAVVAGSRTLTPGQVMTISGTPVSVGSSAVVVGGANADPKSTITLVKPHAGSGDVQPVPTKPIATAGSVPVVADPSDPNAVVLDGTTLTNGGPATTIDGTRISVGPSGVVVGSKTIPLPAGTAPQATRGGLAAAIAGAIADAAGEMAASGIVGGIVNAVGSLAGAHQIVGDGAVITIGSDSVTAMETINAAGDTMVIIGGEALAIGDVITTDGHQISVGASGLVLDLTSTAPFSEITALAASADGAILTIGDQTITASIVSKGSSGELLAFDGHTITPGFITTFDGHRISVGSSAIVMDGTRTITFSDVSGDGTPSTLTREGEAIFTLDGTVFTAIETSVSGRIEDILVYGSRTFTLEDGEKTQFGGHTVSAGGSDLIVDGTSTVMLDGTGSKSHNPTGTARVDAKEGAAVRTCPSLNWAWAFASLLLMLVVHGLLES